MKVAKFLENEGEEVCSSETGIVKKLARWSRSVGFFGSVLSRFGLARPASQLHRLREENQKVVDKQQKSQEFAALAKSGQHAPSRSRWRRPTGCC